MPVASLRRHLLTRLVLAIPTALIVLTLVFVLLRIVPGDPIQAALGGHVPQAEIEARKAAAGYDRPLPEQYADYLRDAVTLDLGTTLTDGRTVSSIAAENGAATLELTLVAFLIALAIGVPVGVMAARRRDGATDAAARVLAIVAFAVPVYFTGLLLQLLFSSALGWLPSSGRASPLTELTLERHTNLYAVDAVLGADWAALGDTLAHLILPALALGLLVTGLVIRLVRVNVLRTLGEGHVEAARMRGVGERRLLLSHVLPNALVPVMTIAGLQFAILLGGAILTEQTFNWPGIGSELVRYLGERDYVAVQGIVTLVALIVVGVSILIDLATALIDPRVRYR